MFKLEKNVQGVKLAHCVIFQHCLAQRETSVCVFGVGMVRACVHVPGLRNNCNIPVSVCVRVLVRAVVVEYDPYIVQ